MMATLQIDTSAIETRLTLTNGRRRERTLGLDDILNLIRSVVDSPEPVAFGLRHGGTVAAAYKYRAFTTVAAVARADNRTVLMIGAASAKYVTPAAVGLPYLTSLKDLAKRDARIAEWTRQPDAIDVSLLADYFTDHPADDQN